ncbi:MAG: P1 family peptidase [Mesorhizobium sp.]
MHLKAGPTNSLTDVAGLRVGHATDERLHSGVTAILCDQPAVAGVQVLGGAPGTRETDLLEAHNAVETINAITLSGGSAFGLDAASGVQAALRERGIGFKYGANSIPIVPAAIIFDLYPGMDKSWDRYPPYRELGYEAANAAAKEFAAGTIGAGAGALTAGLKGGLGTASTVLDNGVTVAALVIANPTGSVTVGDTRHFWAAPFEIGEEFGGLGLPHPMPANAAATRTKGREFLKAGANTTIAVIATDAKLSKGAAKRLAVAAHDGFSRATWPTHTPVDGDLVFGLSTGMRDAGFDVETSIHFYAAAGSTMARAIARAIHAATPAPGDLFPTWQQKFG